MFPAKFEYVRAESVEEAVRLLQENGEAKLLAGGHSLIPMMKLRLAQPPLLIDIGRLSSLAGVRREDGRIGVGALTTHAELADSDVLKRDCPILAEAAAQIADPQVRNRGTIGGNLAHADPGSDLPAVVLALEGKLRMTGPGGNREVPASSFFLDLMTSDLRPDEILTGIEFPVATGKTGSAYRKFEHPASGYAVCGAAAVVEVGDGGACRRVSLCFNGVSATPLRAEAVEQALDGKPLTDETIDRAFQDHLQVDDPMGDLFASGPYRVELARVYGKRALKAARDRAGS